MLTKELAESSTAVAAAAAMIKLTLPVLLAGGVQVNEYDVPLPAKADNTPVEAVISPTTKPVTASLKMTVRLTADAVTPLPLRAMVGVGAIWMSSFTIVKETAAPLRKALPVVQTSGIVVGLVGVIVSVLLAATTPLLIGVTITLAVVAPARMSTVRTPEATVPPEIE